uniref:FLYWCH-type domain-containing protein n=1 Tax=Anopheles merus TaxID=30066 RepID=A0A182UT97_ANOME
MMRSSLHFALEAAHTNPKAHLFIRSQRGLPLLVKNKFIYRCERTRNHRSYWLCTRYKTHKCTGRIICQNNTVLKETEHCHMDDSRRLHHSELKLVDMSQINIECWVKSVPPRFSSSARKATSSTSSSRIKADKPDQELDAICPTSKSRLRSVCFLPDEMKPMPKVWYTAPLTFVVNRRGTQNLHFRGYVYVRKTIHHRTMNWVCCEGATRLGNCKAHAAPRKKGGRRNSFMYDLPYEMINNRKGGLNLHFRGYVYRWKTNFSQTTNWVCANPLTSLNGNAIGYPGACAARCITDGAGGIRFMGLGKWTIIATNSDGGGSDDDESEDNVAVFSRTMRGKEQLVYKGQPFVFEKLVLTTGGQSKKIWRCNQWWNQKCRARVYTIDDHITPLNRYHTHSDIVKRKQRVVKRDKTCDTGGPIDK